MKQVYLAIFSLLLAATSFAAPKITAISNGNWTTNSTWDLNRTPANGDTVIIPAGKTVVITTNQNMGSDFLFIKVYGILKLSGGKLDLNINSVIKVFTGGKITSSGSPSEKIRIGNTEKYRGSDPDVSGPMMADQNSGSGFVPFADNSPLPVRFIGFNVARQNNNVLVQWTTAEEMNSSYFEVQRSENGTNWITIANIAAAGTTSFTHSYSYTDINATAKLIYYRIRQVDIDGKFSLTPVRIIKSASGNAEIKITAASTGSVYVHFSEQVRTNVMIRFTSLNGQTVSETTVNQPVGQVLVPAKKSIKGIYIVTVTNGQDLKVSKQILF